MGKKKSLWKTLNVGDKIRLTEMPPEFFQPGYVIFPETLRFYRKLVARKRALRIREIDEYGHPWIWCRFRRKNGQWEWHSLAVNHDGIKKVTPRK